MAARAPVYERQVGTAALPGVRNTMRYGPEDFGAGVAEQVSRLGTALAEVAVREKRKADLAATMDAAQRANAAKQERLTALSQLKGTDAIGGSVAQANALDTDLLAIRDSLANDEQRTTFERLAANEQLSFRAAADRYTALASDQLAEESYRGLLSTYTSDAAKAAARVDLPAVAEAVARGEGAIRKRATVLGSPVELTDAEIRQHATTSYLAAAKTLLEAGNAQDARAILTQHQGDLDGALVAQSGVERMLAAADRQNEARQTADRLWGEAKGDPVLAAELARAIPETKLFDEVAERIKARASDQRALENLRDDPVVGKLEVGFLTSGRLDTGPSFQGLAAHNQALVLSKYESYVRSLRAENSEERRQQAERDRYLLAWYKALPLKGEQGQDQLTFDLAHDPQMATGSPTLRELVRAEQKKAGAEWAKDRGVSRQAFLDQAHALPEVRSYGRTEMGRFDAQVLADRDAWLQAHPGAPNPPPEESSAILAGAVRKVRVPGFLWGTNEMDAWRAAREGKTPVGGIAPAAPTTPAAPAAPVVPSVVQVPARDRQLIADAIRQKLGRDPLPGEVEGIYTRAQARSR
jgi:hypothetical protein